MTKINMGGYSAISADRKIFVGLVIGWLGITTGVVITNIFLDPKSSQNEVV